MLWINQAMSAHAKKNNECNRLQWGSSGAPVGKMVNNNSGDFQFFLLLYVWCFWGGKLCQNGEFRSPDILQYFLDDVGNFENLVKIWTRRPPNYHQHTSKNTRKYGHIFKQYYFHVWESENLILCDFFCKMYQPFCFGFLREHILLENMCYRYFWVSHF